MSHIYKVSFKENDKLETIKVSSAFYYEIVHGKAVLDSQFRSEFDRTISGDMGLMDMWRFARIEITRIEYSGYDL